MYNNPIVGISVGLLLCFFSIIHWSCSLVYCCSIFIAFMILSFILLFILTHCFLSFQCSPIWLTVLHHNLCLGLVMRFSLAMLAKEHKQRRKKVPGSFFWPLLLICLCHEKRSTQLAIRWDHGSEPNHLSYFSQTRHCLANCESEETPRIAHLRSV